MNFISRSYLRRITLSDFCKENNLGVELGDYRAPGRSWLISATLKNGRVAYFGTTIVGIGEDETQAIQQLCDKICGEYIVVGEFSTAIQRVMIRGVE